MTPSTQLGQSEPCEQCLPGKEVFLVGTPHFLCLIKSDPLFLEPESIYLFQKQTAL
jgi:hypothetical protein